MLLRASHQIYTCTECEKQVAYILHSRREADVTKKIHEHLTTLHPGFEPGTSPPMRVGPTNLASEPQFDSTPIIYSIR
jgi:hypothetical protein